MTDPPFALSERALAMWGRVGGDLSSLAARITAAAYCATLARIGDLEEWIAEHGPVVTITDDKGNVRQHSESPRLAVLRKERGELVGLERAMKRAGLTVEV